MADGALIERANGDGPVVCAWIALLAADDDLGPRSLDAAVLAANGHGSVRALAAALTFRALGLLWRGQLADAVVDASAALDWASGGRVDLDPRFAGAYLADALLEQGDPAGAAAVLSRVGADRQDSTGPGYYTAEAHARLLRRTGRPEEALRAAQRAGSIWTQFGFTNPAIAGWRTEAALAAHAIGDIDAARRWATEELHLAAGWPGPRAQGRALRVSGLVTGSLSDLAESVAVLADGRARLEYARSLVEWGAALRRAGQRTQARDVLGRGMQAAEICGAEPLVEQAIAELRIAGARPRRRYLSGPESLTASERRVAELAAAGAVQPRDRADAVHHRQDRRGASDQRVSQARHHRPARARPRTRRLMLPQRALIPTRRRAQFHQRVRMNPMTKPFVIDRLLDLWSAPLPEGEAAEEAFRELYTDPVTVNGASLTAADLVDRARAIQAMLAGLQREVLDVADAGDKIAFAFRISGRHVGPLRTAAGVVEPTGGTLSMRIIDILTLTDGRISEIVMVADELAAVAGLGLTLTPGETGPAA